MSFRFPQPTNEDDFELFCLRFLRERWRCPTLQQYGKRGERQDGIDLIDEGGGSPLRAVQCKHHEPDKTIPPGEIRDEVAKALGSGLPLDEYHVLTTARKTTHAQRAVIAINRDHAADGRFRVFLWTWADIEPILAEMDDATQDRVLRGDAGRGAPALCRLMAGVMTDHLDRPLYAAASVIDLELDAAKAALDRHEPEVAEHKLKEIEARAADKLQPHHWYQMKALRSRTLSDRWRWEEAGRELIDAKRFMPTTERARVNEALGYELAGDRETAHALATELRREFARSVRLFTVWVRTAPPAVRLDDIARDAAPLAKEDEELNLALAYRAFLEDRFEDAVPYARRATELDPESPHAWFVLGQAEHALGHRSSADPQRTLLREAEGCYDRAVRLAQVEKLPGLEAAVRFNRGQVRHLLGDGRAEADYTRAVELARPEMGLREAYAGYLLEAGRPADALRELAAAVGEPTVTRRFYEAAARHDRNAGDDRQRAAALLKEALASEPAERWADAHILLVQWAVENNTQADARAAITATGLREINPLVYHTLCGWIEKSEGNAEVAMKAFGAAIAAVTDAAIRDHVYLLGQALVAAGDDENAIPLLLRCYRPGVFNAECRKLLGCAQRLGRHEVTSRVCRELREAGETDPRIVLTEIQVRQLYDPQEALRVAREYLARHPGDRHAALWQASLALRLDRRELLISDLARLPAPDDVTPEGSGLVLNVLRETGQHAAALRYAYEVLRAHFGDEFAHGQYVAHFFRLSDHCPEMRVGGTAGPGTAVCYREEREDADRWLVIEDGADPELDRGEYGPDHPVSRALTGRTVGDAVVVSEGGLQPRTVTIREAFHKYIYRFRDCLAQYQVRFHGASAVQMIHVGSGDEFDPSVIIRSLEARREYVERLDELYRTQPMPLPTYAELSGRDEFEAWGHLAASPDLGIRCFNGRDGDLRAGLELARRSKTVVVDLTALYTLANLDLLEVLRSPGRTFVVAQTTYDRLQHLAERADEERDSEGPVAVAEDGKLALIPVTPEARGRYATFLGTLRDTVRGSCVVLPCPQAAELEPARREALIQAVGREHMDSMLLAAAPDTTLWADDLLLGVLGQAEFRASRVWTQAVLFVLRQEGAVTQGVYDQAVAKLVGWHYHGVLWNAETVLAAAETACWQADRWPVPQVMRCFGNAASNPVERLGIAVAVIRSVWRKELLSHQRQGLLFALLTGLGSVQLVRRLGRAVPGLFSVDVFAADEVRSCIGYWLNHPPGPVQP